MQLIKWNGSVLDNYFDETTMSVHFKEWTAIMYKKGRPDAQTSVKWAIISKDELMHLTNEIYAEATSRGDSMLEIEKKYSKVCQNGPYRIVIVSQPLSDGLEMTVVKPVVKLDLSDYHLESKITDLLTNKAKGILISWAPGSGKTTITQAIATLYAHQDKIVKTIESPRDLLVPDEVVQYSFNISTHSELHDILLLSRPDYTFFDEIRNPEDFALYKDLRLAGIGLVGVIHATKPIDGIQRFLGNVEMWVIPQVVDTILYIDGGQITEILQLTLSVKVPEGMMSQDLARPVIQVSSFLQEKAVYEMYTFGEQVVVMPLDDIQKNSQTNTIFRYASQSMQKVLDKMLSFRTKLEVDSLTSAVVYVDDNNKGALIGKGWESIWMLQDKLWLQLQVKLFSELPIWWQTWNTISEASWYIAEEDWSQENYFDAPRRSKWSSRYHEQRKRRR
jgi:ATPase